MNLGYFVSQIHCILYTLSDAIIAVFFWNYALHPQMSSQCVPNPTLIDLCMLNDFVNVGIKQGFTNGECDTPTGSGNERQ